MNDQPVEAGEDSKPFRTLAGIRPESTPIRMQGRFVRIFRLALPIAATEVPVVATIAIDTVLLGQLGASAVAASALGAAVFLFVASICVSIVSSVGHEAAFRCGRRQTRAPNSGFASAAALACVLGVVAAVVCISGGKLLPLLGQDTATAAGALWFLYGIAPGMLPLLMAIGLRGLIAARLPASRLFPVAAGCVALKTMLAVATWVLFIPARSPANSFRVLLACGVTSSLTFASMALLAWRAYRRAAPAEALKFEPPSVVDGASRLLRRGVTIGATALQTGFFTVIAILLF
ncbi:MATE family efflux transporter [Paraburkholderia rhizosphaerae]|uniref:MatE protein n=1 Tax=Paraburkholderia rhizosphaerae TaxID=480658 RepID=A0A4R8LPG1_9BURK|nr:MATE family efflux transporter [Paraburkholderia rhizosphaerae]TDY48182.1 MatE protein [Paraburkholderia rhizosphaerae]